MINEERIEFLQGQVQSLTAFCFAVIDAQPSLVPLQTLLPIFLEGALAKISGQPVPDALVEGIHDMNARLSAHLATAPGRRSQP